MWDPGARRHRVASRPRVLACMAEWAAAADESAAARAEDERPSSNVTVARMSLGIFALPSAGGRSPAGFGLLREHPSVGANAAYHTNAVSLAAAR